MTKYNDNKGFLLPDDKALTLLRKYFVQSSISQGRLGKFHQVRDFKVKGTDQYYTYEKAVDVAYHLVDNPSRKLLTRYGWQVEDQEALPIILYLTYYDINNNPIRIDEGARIELTGKRSIQAKDTLTELFQITEVRSDLELNQCICKITPVREEQKENVKVIADAKDPGLENVYLNREIYYEEVDTIDKESEEILNGMIKDPTLGQTIDDLTIKEAYNELDKMIEGGEPDEDNRFISRV